MGETMTATEIRSKRRKAARMSRSLARFKPNSAERAALWRELADAGVSVKVLAEDSGVTPMAVRAVLNRKP